MTPHFSIKSEKIRQGGRRGLGTTRGGQAERWGPERGQREAGGERARGKGKRKQRDLPSRFLTVIGLLKKTKKKIKKDSGQREVGMKNVRRRKGKRVKR